MDNGELFLKEIIERFTTIKAAAERVFDQLSDSELAWQANPECNSIAILIQHLHGNMLSRWTDTLTTDGEKESRDRDGEFVAGAAESREELMRRWEAGWACLFSAHASFSASDLQKTVKIRGFDHTLMDAILRQYFHISLHVGQMMHIGKEIKGADWQTLSIPRGKSKEFNANPRRG